MKKTAWWILVAAVVGASSCLNRPVTTSEPETSNRFVDQVELQRVDKIDLLFVIDNSMSMADKQKLLKKAVPNLLRRTLSPPCVEEATGAEQPALTAAENPCPDGWRRAYPAIEDVHIGVVSSSLGTNGGGSCAGDLVSADDHGRLLPSVRAAVPSWNGSGYLLWDPRGKHTPPGHSDIEGLVSEFGATVDAVGEIGCGYESTLEAWYRFLVDPEPPLQVVRVGEDSVAQGIDEEILRQRAGFLRPDSLLGIVMLTDEDDCSVMDSGPAWKMSSEEVGRPRPSSACASDPSSVCCRPCTLDEAAPPAGCDTLAYDPACKVREYPLTGSEDDRNLRCAEQKRRFGVDYLHPTSRYVVALTQPWIASRSGERVKNPLFHAADGTRTRAFNRVFLAGILGVPWQDVASPESLDGPGLQYLSSAALEQEGRWPLVLDYDPLMRVSSDPRSGEHPLRGWPLGAPTSLDPQENPINGHEYVNTDSSDLQYACIFPLEEPVACQGETSCDCNAADVDRNRPLCQPPQGGPAGTTQYFAKAYPGRRHLEVLRGLRDSGVVASICPKLASGNPADPSYGYNPALAYLGDVIRQRLERCLPRSLEVEPDGSLPCRVAESVSGSCDCSEPGRAAPSSELESAVRAELELEGHCGAQAGTSCSDFCVCEILQTAGDARTSCQNDPAPSEAAVGYCYVDAELGLGNPELVGECPSTARRTLRFVGRDTPKNGAVTFMACAGAPLARAE